VEGFEKSVTTYHSQMLSTIIGRLRIIGFLEGLSYIILLGIAMPLKYYADMPQVVRVVGMAHGILFIAFIFLTIQATVYYRWSIGRMIALGIASLLPFGTFYVDHKILRHQS
jgi:integral membrane protein